MERNLIEDLTIAAKRFREASPEDRKIYILAVDRLLDEYGVIPPPPYPQSEEVQWHSDGRGSE